MTVAEQVRAEERLSDRLADYAGRWVAVRNHEVVADAATLEKLLEQITEQADEVEVFEVPEDLDAACFY